MSTFPALVPSSRRFTPGQFPHTSMGTLSGRSARVFNVSVELEAIPPQGAIVGGGGWQVRAELAGGAASGGDQFADGAEWTVTISLTAGAASA